MSIPKVQLSLDFLQSHFQIKPPSKTFKTKPREGQSLMDCINNANEFLRGQDEWTRIEFPFDGYYYVIAKLGDGVR